MCSKTQRMLTQSFDSREPCIPVRLSNGRASHAVPSLPPSIPAGPSSRRRQPIPHFTGSDIHVSFFLLQKHTTGENFRRSQESLCETRANPGTSSRECIQACPFQSEGDGLLAFRRSTGVSVMLAYNSSNGGVETGGSLLHADQSM